MKQIKAEKRLKEITGDSFQWFRASATGGSLYRGLGAIDVIIKPSTFQEIVDVLMEKLKVDK